MISVSSINIVCLVISISSVSMFKSQLNNNILQHRKEKESRKNFVNQLLPIFYACLWGKRHLLNLECNFVRDFMRGRQSLGHGFYVSV